MKKCLLKFPWVKVLRKEIPVLKGLMGYWLKLVSRAAFRKGTSTYCGYENAVEPGMWVGGIVGLKAFWTLVTVGKLCRSWRSCRSWAISPTPWSREPKF